jgi:uncharacterized Zn-finger protein
LKESVVVLIHHDEILTTMLLSRRLSMMKFSQAISQVNGLQNISFFTVQPFDLADSPRELHHILTTLFMLPGARPFVCETCNRGFRQKDKLTRHIRIHTGNDITDQIPGLNIGA